MTAPGEKVGVFGWVRVGFSAFPTELLLELSFADHVCRKQVSFGERA